MHDDDVDGNDDVNRYDDDDGLSFLSQFVFIIRLIPHPLEPIIHSVLFITNLVADAQQLTSRPQHWLTSQCLIVLHEICASERRCG